MKTLQEQLRAIDLDHEADMIDVAMNSDEMLEAYQECFDSVAFELHAARAIRPQGMKLLARLDKAIKAFGKQGDVEGP